MRACEPHMNDGAGSGGRTRDLKITNLALCQLSYPGFEYIIAGFGRAFPAYQNLLTPLVKKR